MNKILLIAGLTLALGTTSIMAKAVATVNGMEISVAEADTALKQLTQGKKTWATITDEEKKQLIQMMAPSKLVASKAKKALSEKEKEAALAGFWMQKSMSAVKVSDADAKAMYDKMTKAAKAAKTKQAIPPFEASKNSIKMQIAQDTVVGKLMKTAKIKLK